MIRFLLLASCAAICVNALVDVGTITPEGSRQPDLLITGLNNGLWQYITTITGRRQALTIRKPHDPPHPGAQIHYFQLKKSESGVDDWGVYKLLPMAKGFPRKLNFERLGGNNDNNYNKVGLRKFQERIRKGKVRRGPRR